MKLRNPDKIKISTANLSTEKTQVCFETLKDCAEVYVSSRDELRFVTLRWNFTEDEKRKDIFKILGDVWERSYGDLAWRTMEPERAMPWYFAVSNGSDSVRDFSGRFTECFGVGVRPGAMCCWQYDPMGVTLILDLRNGGLPVQLGERRLLAATVYFREYRDISAFDSLCDFCRVLCPETLTYDKVIYGSNNWYYAYGKSSAEEITADTELIASLCKANKNKPFMVIDDGWQPNPTNPPWQGSEKFGDMKKLAESIAEKGAIPGIWVRYLSDENKVLSLPDEAYRGKDKLYLDPTHPAVREHIINTTKDLVKWGYKLIKHDYSTYDITGTWGKSMNEKVTGDGEGFYDRTKTTAEIFVDFYKLILENAGDAAILGCNTVSHLCAGLVHANRTGDDTSGRAWRPTRKNGINTLAFRLCQNNIFYVVDADCVGILGRYDWKLNRQWLDLAAKSGTSLFVSCKPSEAKEKEEIRRDLEAGYIPASVQEDSLIPLDWMENCFPCEYLVNGEKKTFNWYTDTGADLV